MEVEGVGKTYRHTNSESVEKMVNVYANLKHKLGTRNSIKNRYKD